jgi:hypothetical protein
MRKVIVISILSVLALAVLGFWFGNPNRSNLADAPDRNVPGATTGQGRNTLLSK